MNRVEQNLIKRSRRKNTAVNQWAGSSSVYRQYSKEEIKMANKYSFKLAMWEMQMKELCKFISPKSKQPSSKKRKAGKYRQGC